MTPIDYPEKVYAGLLGMNIGIRLGAPLETTYWSLDRIRETFGDIRGYLKDYRNFAADDDFNGPYYFIRSLLDEGRLDGDRDITPEEVGRAWLNYTRDGKGMFWWGGYGVSAEHTAYANLKAGITPPLSGSAALNGTTLSEQIGGQIFIGTWGLVLPGQPRKAADWGSAAAKVSHDGEALNGARFFCAAIAEAFVCDNIWKIIETSLAQIPENSLYAGVFRAVMDFHSRNPRDFQACRDMLEREWGYDRYPGACPIIPNAGVCALALLYGGGDFNRSIEIAVMCGWDTDCNAANVGTVLAVMRGPGGIEERYRRPVNDFAAASGISGFLNIVDIPSFAKELTALGRRLAGEPVNNPVSRGDICFDFELPGATHGMRVSNNALARIGHASNHAYAGRGSLSMTYEHMIGGDRVRLFYKPYYTREDFDDERYDPVFSPLAYPGQIFQAKLYAEPWVEPRDKPRDKPWDGAEPLAFAPYVRLAGSKTILEGKFAPLHPGAWIPLEHTLPDTDGDSIDELGIIFESRAPFGEQSAGKVYLDDFTLSGPWLYTINFARQSIQFGAPSPFSANPRGCGSFTLTQDGLEASSAGLCEAYTGNYYARNYRISSVVTPLYGTGHMLAIRAQGAMRSYIAGFSQPGRVSILANDFGLEELASADFPWRPGVSYHLSLAALGDRLSLSVDGEHRVIAEDSRFAYGMWGCVGIAAGRRLYGDFLVKGR